MKFHLIILLDLKPLPASRQVLVEYCRRLGLQEGMAFITGPHSRSVQRLSKGLRPVLYNAGMRESVPPGELVGWLPWHAIAIIEQGKCWRLGLSQLPRLLGAGKNTGRATSRISEHFADKPVTAQDPASLIYQRRGIRYADKD